MKRAHAEIVTYEHVKAWHHSNPAVIRIEEMPAWLVNWHEAWRERRQIIAGVNDNVMQ